MPSVEDVKVETDSGLVEWALGIEEGLNEWEVEFVEDMGKRILEGVLSAGRRSKLEQIVLERG